jgi:diguanylate cyclase (GGDEF)-like protein
MTDERNIIEPTKKVEQLIFSDDLTGAFNRRYLYQYLPREMERCKASKQNLWLFMIDIDDFKHINDNYGHLKGDEVLKGVVDTLKESVRSADTVIRYAGDEFTVIILSADAAIATTVAKRIMSKMAAKSFKADQGATEFKVNLSVGIANFPEDAQETLELIEVADKALYTSKQKGKNRFSFVSELPGEMLVARAILEVFPCPKMVEREKQLEGLMAVFEKVKNERKAQTVLIIGAAGTGKSRLAEEFMKSAQAGGFEVMGERCSEKTAAHSFHLVNSALEKYLKKNPADKEVLLEGISPEQRETLSKILPMLSSLYGLKPAERAEASEGMDSTLIQEGLVQIFLNLSRQKKICLMIDDFQWVDIGSLNLLATLRDKNTSLLICCLLRQEVLTRQVSEMPLVQFKDSLDMFFSGKVEVKNLSPEGTSEMIRFIFPGLEMDDLFLITIHRVTQGNPLFIEELLKFLIQKGFLFHQKGQWSKIEIRESDLPHTVEESILERIKGLDKSAQEIIAKAAVIGQDFSTETLHQLGKEDEGYIMDILESARQTGLIKESVEPDAKVPSGENMSFVNEEVRKAIAALIGQDEIKNLHRQLGELEESLNPNNLDGMAAELLYHFKQSQDYERARRYAQMLEETGGFLQSQAVEYTKQILEEREEKVYPLSKKSLALIPHVTRLLYLINVNTSLYPAGSEMIINPLEELLRKFSEIFARDEAVVLVDYKDALVVNGEKLKDADLKSSFSEGLISLFKDNNIESMTFKRGLTKNELAILVENLMSRKEDKSLVETLKAKSVFKIKVKEVDYSAAGTSRSSARARSEEAMLIEQLLGAGLGGVGIGGVVGMGGAGMNQQGNILSTLKDRPQEAVQLINQFADMVIKKNPGYDQNSSAQIKTNAVANAIQKIGEQIRGGESRDLEGYKKGLAAMIMQLDPSLRKGILSNDRTNAPSNDIIKQISPHFSDEVISDVLVEEFSQKKTSIARLKSMVARLLSDSAQKKNLSPQLKEKLNSLGLSREESAWVFGDKQWKDYGLEERLNKFLQMSARDYLSLEQEVDLKSLCGEIINQNQQEPLVKFLNKWDEFLQVPESDLRRVMAINFSGIVEALPQPKLEVLNQLVDFIFKQIQRETEAEIYSVFIGLLATPVDYWLAEKQYAGLKSILARLDKERSRFTSGLEAKAIQAIYDRFSEPKCVEDIIAELLNRIDKNLFYADLAEIIVLLRELMVAPIIHEAMMEEKELAHLGYFGVFLRRRTLGELLSTIVKKSGYDAISETLKEKLKGNDLTAVKSAVDLIMYIQDPVLAGLLSSVINYPDPDVRKKVSLVLSKFINPANLQLLNKMLSDEDEGVKLNVINSLGKVGDKSSLALLRNLKYTGLEKAIKAATDALENRWGKV